MYNIRWGVKISSGKEEILRDKGKWWLGSRAVSVLDSGAKEPGFRSPPRHCRVTVLGKLFTPIVPLFAKQENWQQKVIAAYHQVYDLRHLQADCQEPESPLEPYAW